MIIPNKNNANVSDNSPVNFLDLSSEYEDYDPMTVKGQELKDLNEEELRLQKGKPSYEQEPEDKKGYALVEF
jgi:hypothetical protein